MYFLLFWAFIYFSRFTASDNQSIIQIFSTSCIISTIFTALNNIYIVHRLKL
jgi:hypothetical protein